MFCNKRMRIAEMVVVVVSDGALLVLLATLLEVLVFTALVCACLVVLRMVVACWERMWVRMVCLEPIGFEQIKHSKRFAAPCL